MEELLTRHRSEKKELMAKAQEMKKGIPKSDRQRRAAVIQRIQKLERDLHARQELELKIVTEKTASPLEACTLSETSVVESIQTSPKPVEKTVTDCPRVSRAARRRAKAEAVSRSLNAAVSRIQTSYSSSARGIEFTKLSLALALRNLVLHEVPSDGDCLYASIAHQLSQKNLSHMVHCACKRLDCEELSEHEFQDTKQLKRCIRMLAAASIRQNADQFLPFITMENLDSSQSDAIIVYCKKIETPGTWGGHLELSAISLALGIGIEVIQADGPSIEIGDVSNPPSLTITYHRHAFSLGEHYNSCEPVS